MIYITWKTNNDCDMVEHKLRVTSCDLWVTSCELKAQVEIQK